MRSHNRILRKLAEQNLDTKVAYVASANGELVPKHYKEPTSHKENKNEKEEKVETSSEGNSLEVQEESSKPKKRVPPPKKKKVVEEISTEITTTEDVTEASIDE